MQRRLLLFSADKVCARKHIGPLVVATALQYATVFAVEHQEVVRLHKHIVEFEEGQTLFKALLVALRRKHTVDRKACAYFAQKVNIIEVEKPIGVVDENCRVFTLETYEFCHLLFETIDVVLNGLFGHHRAHIRTTGRVSHHCRATADKDNRTMSRVLQTFCNDHLHKMTYVKTVRRGVETDVE